MSTHHPTSPGPDPRPGARSPEGLPAPGVDRRTGRALPISGEEWAARMEALAAELAEIDAGDDTPHEEAIAFMRDLDEERRRQGRPPAFGGCY